MNHKLALNIEEIERDHNFEQKEEYEIEKEENSQDENVGSEEGEEQDDEDDERSVEGSQIQRNSPSQEYESMETFGNNKKHVSHQQFLQSLAQNNKFPQKQLKQPRLSYLLPDTPIEALQFQDSSIKNRVYQLSHDQSSVDDQINRIISKVMNRNKNAKMAQSGYKKQIEKVSKIDRINKELLNQNAQLIGQINDLEKRLSQLNSKIPSKKQKRKDESNISTFKDKNLTNTLKKYRQKLAKVLDLNSRLSSHLQTERSKSNIISNTQRSVLSRPDGIVSASDMDYLSYIRNNTLLEDKQKKQSEHRGHFCKKCCRQIKKSNIFDSSKEPMFSPVLQVKDYRINSSKKSESISDFSPEPKKILKNTECQVNLINRQEENQRLALEQEERELQAIIERNNQTIQECEQSFYKMVELD